MFKGLRIYLKANMFFLFLAGKEFLFI